MHAFQGDLAQVLKAGRLVAGEVLDQLGGGTLVLGLGGQRVLAESHVDLAPGDRFLAHVVVRNGETTLAISNGNASVDEQLLTALRSLAGSELDSAELIEWLRGAGVADEHLPGCFEPGLGPVGLAALVRRSGLFLESTLRTLAAGGQPRGSGAAVLAELTLAIASDAGLDLRSDHSELLVRLRQVLGGALAEILARGERVRVLHAAVQLRSELLQALAVGPASSACVLLRGHLAGLDSVALEQSRWLPWLALLLQESLDPADRGVRKRGWTQWFQADAKVQLLGLLQLSAPGSESEALDRAVRALEFEQLRNVARSGPDEALHVPFAVPDTGGFATVHLHVPHRREPEGEAAEDPGERISLTVDFSELGPLQADILLQKDRLHLKLTVAGAEIAGLLRSRGPELETCLCPEARGFALTVREAEGPGRARSGEGFDLAYLRDHHLMDLSG